jgi:hypothetical protein
MRWLRTSLRRYRFVHHAENDRRCIALLLLLYFLSIAPSRNVHSISGRDVMAVHVGRKLI